MLLTAIALILLVGAFVAYKSKSELRECTKHIPGPFTLPLIGTVAMYFELTMDNFFDKMDYYAKQYGPIIRFWAINRMFLVINDLKMNEQILSSQTHIVKHHNYLILKPWLGDGLLLSNSRKWYNRRKIITPTFHFKILEQFVEVFDQQSDIFVERLRAKADGVSLFNVYPFVCVAALDVIAETAMGTKIHAQTDTGSEYANAVNEMTRLIAWRFMKPQLNMELGFTLMYPHKRLRQIKLVRIMHDFTSKVIEERREILQDIIQQNSPTADNQTIDVGEKKRMAFLDVLLQSTIDGKPLSNQDIREEVDTFMFEGHDTTTSAISFALHVIARHPEVQERLATEVLEVFGKDVGVPITMNHLNELKYMEWVIKEVLRLYPSVPMIGRYLEEELKYTGTSIGDGVLKPGSELMINIYGMMRDPSLFEKPLEFNPERFNPNNPNGGNGGAISAFASVPFSAGPRNCVGQKFAMLEMKMMIAKVVRAFELLPLGEDVKPEMNVILRSSNGFQLGLKKREGFK